MRFMVLIKVDRNSEAGVMPSEQLLAEMGRFNEDLVKAGRSDRLGQALPQPDAWRVGDRDPAIFDAEDFGEAFTPELREQEERLRAQIAKQVKPPANPARGRRMILLTEPSI